MHSASETHCLLQCDPTYFSVFSEISTQSYRFAAWITVCYYLPISYISLDGVNVVVVVLIAFTLAIFANLFR